MLRATLGVFQALATPRATKGLDITAVPVLAQGLPVSEVRIGPLSWQTREENRFVRGDYRSVPWIGQIWYYRIREHYVHICLTDPTMVSFTISDLHGQSDRKTTMRAGKYLRRYYPRLADLEISTYCATFKSISRELKLATTREEIKDVYLNGPSSCMSYAFPDLDAHPSEMYASGDLGIFYIENPVTAIASGANRIAARCLARIDKPKHIALNTAYGDYETLQAVLRNEGIPQENGTYFEGARLLKEEVADDVYLCPYVDAYYQGGLHEDSIKIGHYQTNQVDLQITSGLTGNVFFCEGCDRTLPQTEQHQDHYCASCFEDNYFDCAECGEGHNLLTDQRFYVDGNRYLCYECYHKEYFECYQCWIIKPKTERSPRTGDDSYRQYCVLCLPLVLEEE